MTTIPILFAFDNALLMPAGVCITSLLETADPDTFYDIFIIHHKNSDFSNSKLLELPNIFKNCRITFRRTKDDFKDAYEIRGITATTYYRLLAPELIPEYDKIIYSDVDVIFREDLSHYYTLDIGNNYFAAVENGSRFRPDIQRYMKTILGLDDHNGYYCAGNLVINSKQLLLDNKIEEFRRLAMNNYKYQDMDIMNIACNGHFFPLGPSFCLTNYCYDLINTRYDDMVSLYGEDEITHARRSGIIHYNGTKPWKGTCMNADVWWKTYRESIFFDEKWCYNFWLDQYHVLDHLPLIKRLKLLLRYPVDVVKRRRGTSLI